jgi:hypothetical protein
VVPSISRITVFEKTRKKENRTLGAVLQELLVLLHSLDGSPILVNMILGPVSLLDCLVFCCFLAPQLLIHVGFFETVGVLLRCLPFLCTLCGCYKFR